MAIGLRTVTNAAGRIRNTGGTLGFLKKLGKWALVPAIFAIPQVASAAGLKYDRNAKPVQGINWGCAARELPRQILTFKVSDWGAKVPVSAWSLLFGPSVLVSLASTLITYSKISECLQEIDPNETTRVTQACADKGIKYKHDSFFSMIA